MTYKITNNISSDLNYIILQCRRSMLELEQILINFILNHYTSLSVFNKQKFKLLLQENDIDLYSWLIAGVPPKDNEIKDLIILIKSFI